MILIFRPQAHYLLKNESGKKVKMQYNGDFWPAPEIATRPPYFTNPRYGFKIPTI